MSRTARSSLLQGYARAMLVQIASGPVPSAEVNEEIRENLSRAGLITEISEVPVGRKTVAVCCITAAGRSALNQIARAA